MISWCSRLTIMIADTVCATAVVVCNIGMERVVFYRERGALPYDPFAYGVAIALVEVPYLILQVRALCGCGGYGDLCCILPEPESVDHTAPVQPLNQAAVPCQAMPCHQAHCRAVDDTCHQ